MHDIINKFVHGMRASFTSDLLTFPVQKLLNVYQFRYFNFIIDLWKNNVLIYNRTDHSITFNFEYKNDIL